MNSLSYTFDITLEYGITESQVHKVTDIVAAALAKALNKVSSQYENVVSAALTFPGQKDGEDAIDLVEDGV